MKLFQYAASLVKGDRQMPSQIDYEREFDDVDRRANEDLREMRWREFIAELKADGDVNTLETMVNEAANAYWESRRFPKEMAGYELFRNFAESEGWSGVFSAIARAIKDEETDRVELERRR